MAKSRAPLAERRTRKAMAAGHRPSREDRAMGITLDLWPWAPAMAAPGRPRGPRRDRLSSGGMVAGFGDARPAGSPGAVDRQLAGLAALPGGAGYWAAGTNGAVFAYGGAHFYGSLLGHHPAGGVVSIVATRDGQGYWLATRDGGVFSFGDAHFYNSMGDRAPGSPVVGMAATPTGHGYWLAAANGGVYSFGDARFFGSLGKKHLRVPVVGIAAAPGGDGYWLATSRGSVFSFGGARFCGSLRLAGTELSAIAGARHGEGYWLLSANGAVHAFGTAAPFGSASTGAEASTDAIAPTPDGQGYFLGSSRQAARTVETRAVESFRAGEARRAGREFLGRFVVTCYDLSGVTASGAMAGPESAAVDPEVIPLGTEIYVDGVGKRTADDTGGAIVGDRVDIWEPSYSDCVDWGVQERAVYRVPGL